MRKSWIALLAGTGAAHAQPPGQIAPVTPAAESRVMDRPWAVAVSLGSLGLRPDRDGADDVPFGFIEIAGRYRLRPTIEVGLALVGGGATEGEVSTAGLYVDGRYRFLAERPWNVVAGLSLGIVSVAREDASEAAQAGRGSLRIALGVERRFRAFALAAEARLVAIGENEDFTPMEATPAAELAKAQLHGGSLSIGGVFYF